MAILAEMQTKGNTFSFKGNWAIKTEHLTKTDVLRERERNAVQRNKAAIRLPLGSHFSPLMAHKSRKMRGIQYKTLLPPWQFSPPSFSMFQESFSYKDTWLSMQSATMCWLKALRSAWKTFRNDMRQQQIKVQQDWNLAKRAGRFNIHWKGCKKKKYVDLEPTSQWDSEMVKMWKVFN